MPTTTKVITVWWPPPQPSAFYPPPYPSPAPPPYHPLPPTAPPAPYYIPPPQGGYWSPPSEPSSGNSHRPVPVYLVKRKVESLRVRALANLAGDDGTHWALEVDGQHYHIKIEHKPFIWLDYNPIEFQDIVESKHIGETLLNHEQIVSTFRSILQIRSAEGLRYDLLANNCRHAVIDLFYSISTNPSVKHFLDLRNEAEALPSSPPNNLVRRVASRVRRFLEDGVS